MIRLAGILLLLSMSVLTGCIAARDLKARVRAVREIRFLIEELRLMIRYEAPEVSEIARRLSEDDNFHELGFLRLLPGYAEAALSGGGTFREAWTRALSEERGYLSEEDISLLERTGSILGSCDCEGQLSKLSVCSAEADRLCEEAREQYSAKGRLYRSLGAIAGALIAVIAV